MAKLAIFSKADTRKYWDELLESRQMLRTWCRHQRIMRSHLILSVQRYFPEEWEANLYRLGPIPTGVCSYCGRDFYKNTGKQAYCDQLCADNARVSREQAARLASANVTKDPSR